MPGHYVRSNDLINNYITYNEMAEVHNATGDYGIVTLSSSSYSIGKSNYVKTGASTTGVVNYYYCISDGLPYGTYIYKYGKTTGLTVGKHQAVSGSYTWYVDLDGDGIREYEYGLGNLNRFGPIDGSVGVNPLLNNYGDSGGPVWFVYDSQRVLLGCISGFEFTTGATNDDITSISAVYYQSIEHVIEQGFIPYAISELAYYDDDLVSKLHT